jgi:nitroreductase
LCWRKALRAARAQARRLEARMTQPDPWAVRAAELPAAGARERLAFCLRYAVLAPSGHNTQPWRFRRAGDALELRADRARALPVVDPEDRELVISCGAALGQARLAAAALGVALSVARWPSAADRDLLARLSGGGEAEPCAEGPAILAALLGRRTHRFAFAPAALPEAALEAAARAAAAEGARLVVIPGGAERRAVARLVAEGDRLQMADPAFRRELAGWLRARSLGARDGMSAEGFGMPDLLTFMGALAIRSFDLGAGQAAKDEALAEGSPALAALCTPGDAPADWLAAGEALAALLARLGRDGLAASYLNQPIEVAALRPRLAALLGTPDAPQLLLRIGRPTRELPATARRGWREVLAEA